MFCTSLNSLLIVLFLQLFCTWSTLQLVQLVRSVHTLQLWPSWGLWKPWRQWRWVCDWTLPVGIATLMRKFTSRCGLANPWAEESFGKGRRTRRCRTAEFQDVSSHSNQFLNEFSQQSNIVISCWYHVISFDNDSGIQWQQFTWMIVPTSAGKGLRMWREGDHLRAISQVVRLSFFCKEGLRRAIYFWYFFVAAGFGIIFGFLVLCFPASLLYLLLCSCAFVLFCFCASVPFYFYYSTFSFLQACVFVALLPAPLLLCFLSILPLCFSFLLLYSLLFVNTLGETQRNLKEILTRNPTWNPTWTLKKP